MALKAPLVALGVVALMLAGCGKSEPKAKPNSDPALTGALADQILVDPDLANQNKGGAAVAAAGPASAELPPEARSDEAIAAAKAEALRLAGGTLQPLPAPASGEAQFDGPMSLGDVAAASGKDCAAKVTYTAAWAAKMPAQFPIYPRGHTREAAGTDADGCRLRVVNFVTPVGIEDALAFYLSRAHSGGFDAEHRIEGTDHVLGGSKGSAAYVVYARKSTDGLTEIDLVTSGG